MQTELSHSENEAVAQLESIKTMVAALKGDGKEADEASERILEDALEIQVRSDWYAPGAKPEQPSEFYILLCTGGPACRIRGKLDENGNPESCWLEHQDWGTCWQEWVTTGSDYKALLTYCQQFYFGD